LKRTKLFYLEFLAGRRRSSLEIGICEEQFSETIFRSDRDSGVESNSGSDHPSLVDLLGKRNRASLEFYGKAAAPTKPEKVPCL
jgi:hypothetical protein